MSRFQVPSPPRKPRKLVEKEEYSYKRSSVDREELSQRSSSMERDEHRRTVGRKQGSRKRSYVEEESQYGKSSEDRPECSPNTTSIETDHNYKSTLDREEHYHSRSNAEGGEISRKRSSRYKEERPSKRHRHYSRSNH
ncbi:hypothetical protein Goarm_014973 [Gossypium armourianum]|nr:hypothetical protein [Gossypium armourianum]